MNLLTDRPLILASASPRRLALLRQVGVEPEVVSAPAEELHALIPGLGPDALTMENARRKARAAAGLLGPRDAWLVAADTVVVCNGRLLGKPADAAEARRMLSRLSGRRHNVHTGICLIDGLSGAEHSAASVSRVWFVPLSAADIDAYVRGGEPLDKAGAYGMQGEGGLFVRRIEGDYTTVVGLSLPLLREMISQAGKQPWAEKI